MKSGMISRTPIMVGLAIALCANPAVGQDDPSDGAVQMVIHTRGDELKGISLAAGFGENVAGTRFGHMVDLGAGQNGVSIGAAVIATDGQDPWASDICIGGSDCRIEVGIDGATTP